MKGGAIANFVYPRGTIGSADGWRSYRHVCLPLSACVKTQTNGGVIANCVCPLGMVENADRFELARP